MIIPLPFKLRSGRQRIFTTKDATEVSVENLVDLVTGKDRRFSRSQAMMLLSALDAPQKHSAFEAVLSNEAEAPELRYEAALHLGRLKKVEAIAALTRNSNAKDPLALRGIVKALGMVGDESAVPALEKIEKESRGFVSKLASFSAAVIAHRHNLAGHDLSVPDPKTSLKLPAARTAPIKFTAASRIELQRCIESVSDSPFGVSIDGEFGYKVSCGKRRLIVLWDRKIVATKAVKVKARKALPAVIAAHNPENDSYSIAYIVLTAPVMNSARINLWFARTNGEIVFSGRAISVGEGYNFEVRATPRASAHAIQVKGEFKMGRLTLSEAQSSTTAQIAKKIPLTLTRVRK
jgi:hypothetical protein